jgi:hypothetical protein
MGTPHVRKRGPADELSGQVAASHGDGATLFTGRAGFYGCPGKFART